MMRRPTAAAALPALAALVAVVAPADAQIFRRSAPSSGEAPCVLDKCLTGGAEPRSAPSAPASAQAPLPGGVAPGRFDFYVLSLSWSPAFCDTGGEAKSPDQCAAGRNLGFVVHGLWPQNASGFPSNCDDGSRFPSRMVLDGVRDLYPDVGLARHEWRTHGTCTGLSPAAYFAAVRQARAGVTIPSAFQQVGEPQTMAPVEIARAFIAANTGLRSEAMAVTCRQGELQEVRLCLAKDLRGYVACPEVSRAACRTRAVSVLPPR